VGRTRTWDADYSSFPLDTPGWGRTNNDANTYPSINQMLSILAAVALAAPPQHFDKGPWERGNDVPGYRLAFAPSVMTGAEPSSVSIGMGNIHGYMPVVSYYVIHEPFVKTARKLAAEMWTRPSPDKDSDDMLMRRGQVRLYKILADRLVMVDAGMGRPVREGGMTFSKEADYTRLRIEERPLVIGPKPHSWPAAGRGGLAPKGFPGPLFKELPNQPDSWEMVMVQSGNAPYSLTWYVHEDAASLAPKLIEELRKSGKWLAPKLMPRLGFWCYPTDSGGEFRLVRFSSEPHAPEVPKQGWSAIEIIWADPNSR